MRIHRFLSWTLVFLALAAQAAAQLANSSLSGTATGTGGSGLPGVTVTLRRPGPHADRGHPGVPGHDQPVRRRARPLGGGGAQRRDQERRQHLPQLRLRRSDWNEKDFFVERSGQQQPSTEYDALGFTVGGPIVRDKAHFFVSYEDDVAQTGEVGIFNSRPELNFTTTVDARIENHLAKLDYQITAGNHLTMRYLRETSPQLNQIVNAGNSVATLAASREESDTDSNWIASLASVFGEAALNDVRVSFTKEYLAFANPAFNNNGRSFEAQRDQAPVELRPTILDGGSGVATARVNTSTQLDDSFSYFLPSWHGEHQLKAGFQYARRELASGDFGTANGQFNFDTDRAFNPDDLTTYPAFFTVRVKGGLDAPIPPTRPWGCSPRTTGASTTG